VIRTERLTLEPLRVEDADEMFNVLADPRLHAFTGGEPPTLDELRERYALQVVGRSPDGTEQWLNWIVRLLGDRQAIGFVQATILEATADIAWVVGTPWQLQGYATEAARAMAEWLLANGVSTLTAHIRAEHAASAAVATAAGLAPTDEVEDGEVVWRSRGRS
jgi:RimJ/RimL family protein N-acetyltransferase